MKPITTLAGSCVGVALVWLCVSGASAQSSAGPGPKELGPELVQAWKKAGAQVGWYGQAHRGYWQFSEAKPKDPAALPGFAWSRSIGAPVRFEPGAIAKLPAPPGPFAVFLNSSGATDAELKELAGLKNLQTLDLAFTKVTDAGLKELAGLKNLRHLVLVKTEVTDAGLKHLAGLRDLQNLDLSATYLTDAALKELAGLKSLHILYLMPAVTDAGLKELAGLKSLQTLVLNSTAVTVAGGAPGIPTGTVTFKDGATVLGTGTLALVGGQAKATFTTSSPLAVGAHSMTAVYGGDANFNTSTSPVLTQNVNKALTTTTLTSSANPAHVGIPVTFTATVAPMMPPTQGQALPTGTVEFWEVDPNTGQNIALLATVTLDASGHASFTTTFLTMGMHRIKALYLGDTNYLTGFITFDEMVMM